MNKYTLHVREVITREWEVTVEGAKDAVQAEEWFNEGNIILQESKKCELIDETCDTEVLDSMRA